MEEHFNENLILFDWLTCTYPTSDPVFFFDLLELSSEFVSKMSEGYGLYGYAKRYFYSGISIMFDGYNPEMGVCMEFSGQGCRAFETYSSITFDELFRRILHLEIRVTRLDIAFDDHTGVFDIERICQDVHDENIVTRMGYRAVHYTTDGDSCEIGKRGSKTFVRIYDKAAERGYEDGRHWIRLEILLRKDNALAFIKNELPIGEKLRGVVYNYLRFVVPNPYDDNRSRWKNTDYWDNFVASADKIKIFTAPGIDYNFSQLEELCTRHYGNAFRTYLDILGEDEVSRRVHEAQVTPNPKYQELRKQFQPEIELQHRRRLAKRYPNLFTNEELEK